MNDSALAGTLSSEMETVGKRIRYLRTKILGITQEEFARPLRVTRGAVGNWEREEGITRENLVAISMVYPAASFEWLATGRGRKPSPTGHPPPQPTISTIGGVQGIPPDATAEIDVTAGLGGGGLSIVTQQEVGGAFYAAEEIRDYWRLPEWLLSTWANARAQHVVCFPAQGDSMSPTIQSGDVVFADLRHRVPSPPGIYVLADAFGGVVAKRLEVVSKRDEEPVQVKVSSDNPRHETAIWTLDELHIIGRYLGRFTAF
jgi:phage repressor protein C with HTH and peptisase S24 domain